MKTKDWYLDELMFKGFTKREIKSKVLEIWKEGEDNFNDLPVALPEDAADLENMSYSSIKSLYDYYIDWINDSEDDSPDLYPNGEDED